MAEENARSNVYTGLNPYLADMVDRATPAGSNRTKVVQGALIAFVKGAIANGTISVENEKEGELLGMSAEDLAQMRKNAARARVKALKEQLAAAEAEAR